MMKLLHQRALKGLFTLGLFLTAMVSWGQAYTLTWTNGSAAPTAPTGIQITQNYTGHVPGSACNTASNGSTTFTTTIKAATGYNFTITSINGVAARSSAGCQNFQVQLVNNGTLDGAVTNVPASSSCGGNTAITIGTIPSANQTVLSGSSATVNVLRTTGCTGYAHTKSFTITGVVTSANSNISDIIRTATATFNEPANIDYKLYQATDVTAANSIEVGSFDIRDGAGTTDTDALGTTLSAVSFTVTNASQLRRLALYHFNGSTWVEVGEQAAAATVTFTGLSGLVAADGATKNFRLRATFAATVTDKTQFSFAISAATADSAGSTFTAATTNGTVKTLNTVNGTQTGNRIEVTADRLAFGTQPAANTNVNTAMANVTVKAIDANNNTDTDFTGTVTLTSTGTLSTSPGVNAVSGTATFSGLTHTAGGTGLKYTAAYSTNSWSVDSNTFNINKLAQTISNFTANITKTYGDADFTLGATASSGLDVVYTSSDESVATVTDNTVTILKNGSITITATQPGNGVYSAATSVPRTLTVSKKQLAVTGAVAQSKVYDGSVDAVITGAALSGGIVGSDDVTLDALYVAEFNNKNSGTAKPVESAFQLAGAQAGRYILTDPTGLTADITAKELTITGITIADKDFDSDTDATIVGTPVLNGIVGSEDVTLNTSAAIAVFDNIGPGATIPVTVSGYTINGADIANYTLTQPQGLTANINETGLANQTITFGELDAVTYGDGDFTLNATASSGLTVTYTSSDENVATVSGNTVTITGSGSVTITAYQEGNGTYNPASAVAQGLIVNKKTITVADAAITDKVYNKTTSAIATGTLSGLVGGDAAFVELTGTGVFASDDVANGIVVTTNYAISGTRAYNYILTQPGDQTGNITPAELTLATATAANKIYNGTNTAVVNGTLNGIFAGDIVTYNGTGTFATVDVATGIAVTATATLTGADAGNYYLTQPTGLTADITAKTVTVTATAENKEYNRTTDAVITVTAVNGLADGDVVNAIGGGTFNNFNVGTGKPVTTALTLTGDDAANYTLTQPTGLTADITAKSLTVTSADVTDRAYNGTTNATITNAVLDGIVAGDEAAVTIVAGTFAQAAPGTDIAVSNLVLSGTAAGNYTLTQPEGLSGDITGTVITLSGATAQNKIYDGTTDAVITGTLTGVAPGDIVTFTGTGTFASKDVANGIEVTPSITLGGEDALFYILTQPTGLTANITKKTLTVTATAENKVYDRTTDAVITVASINGIVDGDDIEVTGGGNFNNLNAGTAKSVTGALVLGGGSAANYTLTQPTGLTADVTKVNLTVTSADVVDRAYNGTTNATIANAVLDGIVAGDEAAVTIVAGTFAQATPGTDIAVSNLVLSGVAAGNYTLTQPEGLTGDITGSTLTLAGAAAQNKIYDGTTAATITGTLSGVAPGDIVTFTGTGTFASEDVANGIEVTPTITLGGEDAMYYTLIQPTGLTANITKKTLTISGLTADNKVYNKTTTATLSGTAVLTGVLNNDDVSLDGIPVANFNNFNVGTSKPVTVTGYVLADDASNYMLAQPTGLTANITAKPLTLSGGAVTTKTYNATTAATVTGTLVGVESGDVVTANTGTFASANAGTQNVTVLLTGANAANYMLTQPNPLLTGTINKAALTVTADNKSKTFNTANPALTVSYSGFAGSDNATDDADFTPPTVTTTAVTGSAVGAYPITFATTGDAMNYNMNYVNGTLQVNQSATTQAVLSWDFTGEANGNTSTAEVINSSLAVNGVLSRGADAPASAGSNSFRTVGFQNNGISVSNTDYFQFSVSPVAGKLLNLRNLNAQFGGTATFSAGPTGVSGQFAYSLNGTTFTLIGSPFVLTGDFSSSVATMPQIDLSGITALQNVPATTTVTFRFYASGQTATGGWGFKSPSSGSAGLSVGAAFTDEAKLPVISNITNNSTTVTTTYGTATSFDANVNADATPTVTFSAVFPTGVNGKASIDPATGIITFNNDIDASATPYSISVNSKSYFNTVTNPATNGDTKVLKLKVNKKNQDITFDTTPSPLPDNMQPGYVFTVESNVAAGLPVATWASSNTGVATVADNGDGTATVTIVAAGSANITASNAGNGNYNAFNGAAVSVNITTLTAAPATIALVGYNGQPTVAAGLDNITAGNLSPASGDLTVTVTDGTDYFEVSNTAGSGFDTTFAFAYASASFNTNNPAIYVRLKEGLAIGSYTGTITISGGGATTTVALNGAVQDAPVLTTSTASYGPYCAGADNTISVDFTTEGDLPAGNFYVQVSDAMGNFPPGFTNIISAASATSPITATLSDDLIAGNYRVRVVHYSNGSLLTASMANNGSDIVINAKPTLTGVQVAVNCAGAASEVSLTGLIPETAFSIDYTIGAGAHTATVTSDAGGNASFAVTLNGMNDGQLFTVISVTRTDVTPSCPAAFTVSTTIVIDANTWTGAAGTSDWNDANNWSCGEVPTQYIRAVIAAGANQPEITDNDTVAVASLTIEDGAEMIVRSGSNISVTNAVVVAEGGMFTLENNANLIQVNDVDNTGDITVIKNSAPMFRLDYALWSSPVTGGSLVEFSPLTLSNRYYHYNPLSDAYAPIPGTTLFEEGSGYLIRVANNHPAYAAGQTGTSWTGTFEGTPNNGDVNVAVTPANGAVNGYNAVGNPYPSPINIAAFYAANANNLGDDTSLYFWRKKNDENTSCYASLTLTGYTANSGNAFGDSSNGVFNNPEESDTWVINPGQGFIVQADGNTIAFNNEMRVAVNNNQQFRNAQDEANTGSRLWLNITGAPGEFHQALVAYTNNTTLGLDYGWDGKALTDGTVAIYSLTGASKLGIQARPAFDAADVVPMGYKATTAGSHTITLDHMDGVFSQDQNVYLKDNLFGTTHNLKLSAYEFATEAGTFEGRFEVVYAAALGTDIPAMNANSIIVYKQGSSINISSGTTDMTGVTVYDLRGRMLYSQDGINASETVISSLQAQEQMLIVEVTTLKGKVSKKIIF